MEAAQNDVDILEGLPALSLEGSILCIWTWLQKERYLIYSVNKTAGCTWALTQSFTESSQQQFSACSHLLFPLSLGLFPLSWCQHIPGSFATSVSCFWLTYPYVSAVRLAPRHRCWWFTPRSSTPLGTKSLKFASGQIQTPLEHLVLPVKR